MNTFLLGCLLTSVQQSRLSLFTFVHNFECLHIRNYEQKYHRTVVVDHFWTIIINFVGLFRIKCFLHNFCLSLAYLFRDGVCFDVSRLFGRRQVALRQRLVHSGEKALRRNPGLSGRVRRTQSWVTFRILIELWFWDFEIKCCFYKEMTVIRILTI